jgi:hypothetical protein
MILVLLHITFLAGLSWFFIQKKSDESLRSWLWIGLGIRVIAGLAFAIIFTYYVGSGDTLSFFSEAGKLASKAKTDFIGYISELFSNQHAHFKSESRNDFFVKIVSLFSLITNHNYWITTLYFAAFSFLAVGYFIQILSKHFPQTKFAFLISFLIIPTPIFWNSGILKDTLIFSIMVVIAAMIIDFNQTKRIGWRSIVFLVIGTFILWKLRHFTGALAVLMIFSTVIQHVFRQIQLSLKWRVIGWTVALFTCILAVSILNRNLNLNFLPQAIYDNYISLSHISTLNKIDFSSLLPTWKSLIFHMPKSFITGLYRPFIWEGSAFLMLHKIENLVLIILSIFALRNVKLIGKLNFLSILAICLIAILATLMPLASPNFGTLMRYKAIYLPFVFYLLALASQKPDTPNPTNN